MAVPTKKSKAVEDYLEKWSKAQFGRSRLECIKNDVCVCCGQPAKDFKDDISKKEFRISGFCQKCQNKIWR